MKTMKFKRVMLLATLLVMTLSAVTGGTIAWFTDSVTSASNVITSGNLDIELEYWNGTKWEDVSEKSDILTNTLWEPGAAEVAYLRVANAGSLAIDYKLGINIASETEGTNKDGEAFNLSEHIQFGVVNGVNGETGAYASRKDAIADVTDAAKLSEGYTKAGVLYPHNTTDVQNAVSEQYLALVVYMPTTVGNEANHNGTKVPQIDLGIYVVATQYTYEEDSFNNQYDADAKYPPAPGEFAVSTADEFMAAVAAAKVGNVIDIRGDITLPGEVTLPAGIVLNGDGVHQINGTVYAGGDLTITGHVKIEAFSASYYNRVITIGEGACLEITGGGRVSLAYENVFNITGTLENAKTADKSTVKPSLIIPAGLSITGGSNATLNVTNAYVQIGDTSSKNSVANGTFNLNFNNSIVEFTKQLTMAEPTSGKAPTFNINIKDSVLTTGTKLIVAAPDSNVVIDNSVVTLGTYFRNSGNMELKNGSVLTGSTIQFGENGGNNGTITVDGSTFNITASAAGHALDGKGTGKLVLKNGATASVTYYKAMTVESDATSTFTGTEVQ